MALKAIDDVFFTWEGTELRYRIRIEGLNEIIYEGKAYAKPNSDTVKINVSRIIRNYLENDLPCIADPEDDYSYVCNEAYKNFFIDVYDPRTDSWSEEDGFDFLWYYDNTNEIPYLLSDPVNGHSAIGVKNLLTTWDVSNGVETSVKTSYEVVGCEIKESGGGGGDDPTPRPDYRNYLQMNITCDGYIRWKTDDNSFGLTIEYRKNGGDWIPITATEDGVQIPVVTGDVLQFRGNNDTYSAMEYVNTFGYSTACFNLSGNIMSLFNPTSFESLKTFPSEESSVRSLFAGTNVGSASGLILPATALTPNCYQDMFFNCTGLTSVPNLPATRLAPYCYSGMYSYTPLSSVPSNYLPATTLAEGCYSNMFAGTGLRTAPQLPATTLADRCYYGMFEGCGDLTTAPALPATTLAESCYQRMFRNCTSLTTAPDLPATTLVEYCYNNMFRGCSSLNYIKCLATDISASYCTSNWVNGVASTGTFVKARGMNDWLIDNVNGIPIGWTIREEGPVITGYLNCTGGTPTGANIYVNGVNKGTYNGGTKGCGDYEVGTQISWSASKTGYTTDSGNITIVQGANNFSYSLQTIVPSDYLKFNITGNGTINWRGNGSVIEYRKNGGEWTSITSSLNGTTISVANGDILEFRGDTASYGDYQGTFGDFSGSTAQFTVNGNIMSLIDSTNFSNLDTLESGFTFANLFTYCTGLTDASGLQLPATALAEGCYNGMFKGCSSLTKTPELPATTLTPYCYAAMFYDCTSLVNLPVLPATTLAEGCYSTMFEGCTSLTSVPSNYLPATTLAEGCYASMFYGCTSLTQAPVLPATTLVKDCYKWMFYNCSNLNYIKCLATNISATDCTDNWVDGVAATGTFVKVAGVAWLIDNIDGIPIGWTVINDGDEPEPPGPDTGSTSGDSTEYLTIEFISGGSFDFSTQNSNKSLTISYKRNSGNWTSITSTLGSVQTITGNTGDKIYLKGSNSQYIGGGDLEHYGKGIFTSNDTTTKLKISNNIMSLIWGDNFSNKTYIDRETFFLIFQRLNVVDASELVLPSTVLAESCYYGMFENCIYLTKVPVLPATSLAVGCYSRMFYGCTGLNSVPALPATRLELLCYDQMFLDCTSLTTVPSNMLPATTLAQTCYEGMFQGCTSLTTAPVLPATALAEGCYNGMFNGCTSLTQAPVLPATTLAIGCYLGMFAGCTSLTSVPTLPATTLAKGCYDQMFLGCTSLTTVPSNYLPATTLAENCYMWMFATCTGLTTAPALPATTLEKECYSCMFQGCSGLTTAPDLPAPTLVTRCYRSMFSNTSLNYIKCLATNNSADECTQNWLYKVPASGTFVKAEGSSWSNGANGIPYGWTAQTNSNRSLMKAGNPLKSTIITSTSGTVNGYVVCYCGEYALYYQNRRGGWDTFLFEGTCKKIDDYGIYKYTKNYDNTKVEFGSTRYLNAITEKWELNSGWLKEDESRRFAHHLLSTNQAYLHILAEDRIIPVVITDSQAEYKTYATNDYKPINYRITVENSQKKYRR